ncbi:hypothetical protein FGB62_130g034 [Gracilaria domingensis]|nr:hypothetical protein FGB62_130g034 [Gracilaria domingensis]
MRSAAKIRDHSTRPRAGCGSPLRYLPVCRQPRRRNAVPARGAERLQRHPAAAAPEHSAIRRHRPQHQPHLALQGPLLRERPPLAAPPSQGVFPLQAGVLLQCRQSAKRLRRAQSRVQACKHPAQLQRDVEAHTRQLSAYTGPLMLEVIADPPRNIFQQHGGHFWGVLETRDCCRARCELANEIEHMAHWYEVAPLLEFALTHRLELLRLMVSDNLGSRDVVPFTMLRLNQDERCAAFITHWLRRVCAHGSDEQSIGELHEQSAEGDWLYGNADCYADVFETVRNADPDQVSIAMLIALCIIKLRIIAKYDADRRQMEMFQATFAGRQLDHDSTHITAQSVVGDHAQAQRVAEQERLVDLYFDIIHEHNPTLLPSIINPRPLKSCDAPPYCSPGKPSEAYYVLMGCNRLFVRVPGAEERLKRRFGSHPQYDCHM